jgi:hypothetical protein
MEMVFGRNLKRMQKKWADYLEYMKLFANFVKDN